MSEGWDRRHEAVIATMHAASRAIPWTYLLIAKNDSSVRLDLVLGTGTEAFEI
jgi:hypothetical protein